MCCEKCNDENSSCSVPIRKDMAKEILELDFQATKERNERIKQYLKEVQECLDEVHNWTSKQIFCTMLVLASSKDVKEREKALHVLENYVHAASINLGVIEGTIKLLS